MSYLNLKRIIFSVVSVLFALLLMQCDTTKLTTSQSSETATEITVPTNSTYEFDSPYEARINEIISQMTLDEKIGQLALRGTSSREKGLPPSLINDVKDGKIGAFLNVMDTANIRILQETAVNESKYGIPLIFARDVIHGFKTIFPIPLGQAASWNMDMVEEGSRIAALEASSVGIRWTFAPMLDICQDSRWGRIAESPGEDPYLATQLSSAYVNGFQGDDLSDPTTLAACAKHFLAYGAAIGGRDYNTAILSDEIIYNTYLPPFERAVDAGVATVMSSFNELNGIPATGNKEILTNVLRGKYGFDGFVVSDWESVTEMIAHGYAADERHAAELSAIAGMDMEMTSRAYDNHLKNLIEEGIVNESQLNFYVSNILRIKFRMGLFDQPYIPNNHPGELYAEEHLTAAKNAAIESTVLLKNDGLLPLASGKRLLITGPLADKGREQLGTWTFDGEGDPTITPVEAMPDATFVEGLSYSRDMSEEQFSRVTSAAQRSDVIIFVGGEEAILSGEAHSRGNIRLPGAQEALIKELIATGKPVILVIMAGRPINITDYIDDLSGVLMMWHPGTMGGPALKEILHGDVSPSGKLPVSWPKAAGQLPYFYNHKNTGRPANAEKYVAIDDIPIGAWQSSLGNQSHYLDYGYNPLFPFGYGLSYSEISYSKPTLSSTTISEGGSVTVSCTITNSGNTDVKEVAQCYIRDRVGRVTRPVKELKGFDKLELTAGETKTVTFDISYEDLKYYDSQGVYDVEAGEVEIFVGGDSNNPEYVVLEVE